MNWFVTHFFNRIPENKLALVRLVEGRPNWSAWTPYRGGFQIFGGRTWTVSFIRLGESRSWNSVT